MASFLPTNGTAATPHCAETGSSVRVTPAGASLSRTPASREGGWTYVARLDMSFSDALREARKLLRDETHQQFLYSAQAPPSKCCGFETVSDGMIPKTLPDIPDLQVTKGQLPHPAAITRRTAPS